jgi:hypothetical protein
MWHVLIVHQNANTGVILPVDFQRISVRKRTFNSVWDRPTESACLDIFPDLFLAVLKPDQAIIAGIKKT